MNKIFKDLKAYSIITIGLLINAIGWTAFLIPAKITGGGVTGIATLIFYATEIPVWIPYLIINSILILVSIKILGRIDSASEIINIMLENDIYVHPSHIENSPNSVCEAMSLGMPVIATATGGTFSLVKDNDTGILIQDGDPWSMAGTILEIYRNNDRAKNLGERARKAALERHDPNKIVSNLINIYSEILCNDNSDN